MQKVKNLKDLNKEENLLKWWEWASKTWPRKKFKK